MKELIVISTEIIGSEEVSSVNSRGIHEYLEINTKYSDWINRAIAKYEFEDGVDFQLLKSGKSNSNNPMVDYIVTIDMAKELCMVSNTPKGRETRKYFIQAEKNLREISKDSFPQLPFARQEMNLKDKKLRKAFYKAFGGKCYYTKKKLHVDNFHIDHIMPKSLGGGNTLSNLVLCDPSENSRKLNSYDKSFVEHHQAIVVKDFAPLVYAIYISNQGSLVAPGVNPTALLTAPMMTKMEKMFGFEATREFYAKLIPGIELKAVKKRESDNIDKFINDCIVVYDTIEDGRFTSMNALVEAYYLYCDRNNEACVSDRTVRTQLKKRTTAVEYRATIDGERARCLSVELVD